MTVDGVANSIVIVDAGVVPGLAVGGISGTR